MFKKHIFGSLAFIIVLITVISKGLTAAHLPNEGSRFGIFAGFVPKGGFCDVMGFNNYYEYTQWADTHYTYLGAHWTRSNTQLIWDLIEPVIGGGYDWSASQGGDSVISAPFGCMEPVNWLGVFHEGGDSARNPVDYLPEYAEFVSASVERYDGDGYLDADTFVNVKWWQCGNEVFLWNESGRTVSEYCLLVATVDSAARSADPEAKIVLIAPTRGFSPDSFIMDALDTLSVMGVPIGAIDVHHWGKAFNWHMDAIPMYREHLDDLDYVNTQIWSCEHATYCYQPADCPYQTQEEQASSLVRRYCWNLANGLDKLFWNNLVEWRNFSDDSTSFFNCCGLIGDGACCSEPDSELNKPRVAYWVYKNLATLIDSPSVHLGEITETRGDNMRFCFAYQDIEGDTFYIAWAETDFILLSFDISFDSICAENMITDRYSNILWADTLSGGIGFSITLGWDPILIYEYEKQAINETKNLSERIKLVVYPNPFTHKTVIEFKIKSSEFRVKRLTTPDL